MKTMIIYMLNHIFKTTQPKIKLFTNDCIY